MKNKMKRKDNFFLLFLLTFIIISMLVVRPDDKKEYETGFTSEELKIKEKTDSELITYTYINSSGENTVAIDKGYAIREQLSSLFCILFFTDICMYLRLPLLTLEYVLHPDKPLFSTPATVSKILPGQIPEAFQ